MSDFVVNLPVPYKSEWDADASATSNDCGPSSAGMVMGFYKENHTTDEIFAKTGAGQGLIPIPQILTAIKAFGFNCESKSGVSFIDIQNLLKQGIPVIALVKAAYLTSRQDQGFGGGHFIVIDGYRDDGITANDPDFYGEFRAQGDHHFYTMSEFTNAWGNCHLDGNPDNTIIIIYPKTPQVDYESLYNAKREECDDNWNIADAALKGLNIQVKDNLTHEDKVSLISTVTNDIQALKDSSNYSKEKLKQFSDAGYNSVADIQIAIDKVKGDTGTTDTNLPPTKTEDAQTSYGILNFLIQAIKAIFGANG